MKNKRIFYLTSFLLLVMMLFSTFNAYSYAVTLPALRISSGNYSPGDKMCGKEVTDLEVDKTLQLYATIGSGNDVLGPDGDPDSLGWFISVPNLGDVTWTSSDTGIATVDNTGKVTGVSEGKATITAQHDDMSDTYEVNVKPEVYAGIRFRNRIPSNPVNHLNMVESVIIDLNNIHCTEEKNIKFSIEDESIAQIVEIDLSDVEEGYGAGAVSVSVKFLSLGETKMVATLECNGETYTDTRDFYVVDSSYNPYYLLLYDKEYPGEKLPSSLKVGDKMQLIAIYHVRRGSLLPEDVTSEGVEWTSSDEKIVKVDSNGLLTAVGEGTATITAKYETAEGTYDVKITDPNGTSADPQETDTGGTGTDNTPTDNTPTENNPEVDTESTPTKKPQTTGQTVLPQAGENITMIVIGIILLLSMSIVMYKRYKKYKDFK